MRKIIMATVLVIVAQSSIAQKLSWGVKVGGTISVFNSYTDSIRPIGTFHGGGFAEYKINGKFKVQHEILYAEEGVKLYNDYYEGNRFVSTTERLKLKYINLPVILKYYVIKNLSIDAGPQIGIFLDANSSYTSRSVLNGNVNTTKGTNLSNGDFRRFNGGLIGGVSYNLTEHFIIQGRIYQGLTSFTKGGYYHDDSDGARKHMYTTNVQLSVGYEF